MRYTSAQVERMEVHRDWLRRNRVKLQAAETALATWQAEIAKLWKERMEHIVSGLKK